MAGDQRIVLWEHMANLKSTLRCDSVAQHKVLTTPTTLDHTADTGDPHRSVPYR
jgi:hypothetical protein